MPISLVCALSLVLAGLALAGLALRYEHLVVLYLPRVALFFLERREGERYVLVSPLWVPVAVMRFAAHAVTLAPSAARRAASRVGIRVALPASGKA